MRFLPLLLVSFLSAITAYAQPAALAYTIDVRPADDLFHVEVAVTDVTKANAVYQFAATAPGTYQVMDIGRFVRSFEAFDAAGKALPVKKVGENQWRLGKPTKTRLLRYTIAETWDTPVKDHPVYRMCGTSIEADHVLFNAHCVVGYFTGQQARPLRLRFEHPAGWQRGTVLAADPDGSYLTTSFDHAVDSPVLLGRLTQARTKVGDTEVALYCYSKTGLIKADTLLGAMRQMLGAAQQFLVKLPVPRYAFLYHFEDVSNGAWEHSYSSEYVIEEDTLTRRFLAGVVSTAAHEFFHIVTPLNLHSEVIEHFNFVNPTGSEHLWLYEGVTEWASDLMQLRGGMIPLDMYLSELSSKVNYDHYADTTYALSRLGLKSFTDEGQKQYGNIYQRGAVTAALLDLRLLELSGGKRGLREVLLELTKRYGPSKPFAEKSFMEEFTRLTYPEIGDFFARYVRRAEPLPLAAYFGKVGVGYQRRHLTGKAVPSLNVTFMVAADAITMVRPGDSARVFGIAENDELLRINEVPVTAKNFSEETIKVKQAGIGTPFTFTVRRGGQERLIRGRVQSVAESKKFYFFPDPAATPAQLALRTAWLRNLPL
ncbi:MAG: peptidase [Hymenobacteraceae bacterium]|nr:peptidase [Hymenobacteraceae bacterium]